jgi:alcohol dehydrogenase (cytochrome c)
MNIARATLTIFLTALPAVLPAQILDPSLLLKPPTNAWPTYNGDYSGRRFSPLSQINQSNIKNLNLAWIYRVNVGDTPGAIVGGESAVKTQRIPSE